MKKEFVFRPRGRFLQIPDPVLWFVIKIRPASMGKLFLYLYFISIGTGSEVTPKISVRDLAAILNMKKSKMYDNLKTLQEMGALEVVEQDNLGTAYRLLLPQENGGFLPADKTPYLWEKGKRKQFSQDTLF